MAHRTIVTGGLRKYLNVDILMRLRGFFECDAREFYHVTNLTAAKSILEGSLRLTRADTFLDNMEIKFGLTLFRQIIDSKGQYSKVLHDLLGDAEIFLQKSTFVFSTVIDYPDQKHIEKYGGNVLKCQNALNERIFYHAHEVTDEGKYYLGCMGRYKLDQGKVIYDLDKQIEIANLIIDSFIKYALKEDKDRELFEACIVKDEMIIILTTAICLFKKKKFEIENEYRFIAFSKTEDYWIHNEIENHKKFISLRYSNSNIFTYYNMGSTTLG